MTTSNDTTRPQTAKRRKWPRRLAWAAGSLVALAVGGWYVATHTFVTRLVVCSQVSRAIGADVDADAVTLERSGTLVIENARVRVRGVAGPAGEIFAARRIELRPSYRSFLAGGTDIARVELDEPTIRFSQSVDDGTLNVAKLVVPAGGKGMTAPPSISVRGGVLELGEHRTIPAASYAPLRRINVTGEVLPEVASDEWTINFREDAQTKVGPRPMKIEGRWSNAGLSLRTDGLTLESWPIDSVPTPLRDFVRRLDLQGRVGDTTFNYSKDGQVRATIDLVNVALNLPVEAQPADDAEGNPVPVPEELKGKLLRMSRVNGQIEVTNDRITGDMSGLVEELPYFVSLRLDGASSDAPFTLELWAKGFKLTEQPQVMRFAPGLAQRRLNQFGNPTGIVDATVVVSRGEGQNGQPGEVKVSGEISFTDGSAAFERFPYRFHNMTGRWRFDENSIDILGIKGESPSGAKVWAKGRIAPLNNEAEFDLDVFVNDLPVDQALADSMGQRRKIIDALFNAEQYKALLDAKLVATPDQRREAEQALKDIDRGTRQASTREREALEATKALPVFEPGGVASVTVKIRREPGPESVWNERVDIKLPQASILAEKFPYPMLAKDVRIVKVNDAATVEIPTLVGLNGGRAGAAASVDFAKIDDPSQPFVPELTLWAEDTPADPLLVFAVPRRKDSDGVCPHVLLETLNPRGTIQRADVRLGLSPANDVAYSVDLRVKDATLATSPYDPYGSLGVVPPPRVVASGVAGTVGVTQDRVRVDLAGESTDLFGTAAAPIKVTSDITLGDAPDTPLHVVIQTQDLDVNQRVEDLANVFSPDSARAITTLRLRHNPQGLLDVGVDVRREAGGPLDVGVSIERPRVALDVGPSRVEIQNARGMATIGVVSPADGGTSRPARLRFDDFAADLASDTTPAGSVRANGSLSLQGNGPEERLDIRVERGFFDSGLLRHGIEAWVSGKLADVYRETQPSGEFDAAVALFSGNPASGTASGAPIRYRGIIQPRQLALTLPAGRIDMPSISGAVEFADSGGTIRELRLAGAGWSLDAQGSWFRRENGDLALETTFNSTSDGIPPDFRAALPGELLGVIDELKLVIGSELRLAGTTLALNLPKDGSSPGVRVAGKLDARDARLDVGVNVERLDALADFRFSKDPASPRGSLDLKVLAEHLAVLGVSMHDARLRLFSEPDGSVRVPLFVADCHGGRVSVAANLDPPLPTTPGDTPREYRCDVRATDVRFAPVLAQIEEARKAKEAIEAKAQGGPETIADAAPPQAAPDESRGRVDAQISFGGRLGESDSRRGRGYTTIGGGSVFNMPLVVPLVRLGGLTLPVREQLDYAQGTFFLQGDTITFEDLSLTSASVRIYGYGTVRLPEGDLDLRFRARNRGGIPLVSQLLDGLRNELISAEAGGTLGDPQIKIVTFAGTGRALGQAFGASRSESDKRLDRIEADAGRARTGRPTLSRDSSVTPTDR